MLIEFAISIYIYFCMYFHLYFWMYFHEFKYSIPLAPVGIPSIDLYFFTIFVCAFSCNWGWLVSAGTLRWWPLKKYIWDQDLPSPTSVQYNSKVSQYGVLQRLSRWPKGQFGRRRLQQYILNVFCLSTIVFAYVTQIKSTYLLTYLLIILSAQISQFLINLKLDITRLLEV